MMAAIFNLAILDSTILVIPLILTHTCQEWFPPFAQKKTYSHFPPHHLHKKLHSFILTQLDDGSHLEFWHVEFRHCHLGFRHLVIFSQIHSKTLSLHSDSEPKYFNMTQTHSFSCNLMMAAISNSAILDSTNLHKKNFTYLFWLNLMMAVILNSAIFNSTILHSAILHKTLTQTNSIWLKVIHSDSTWWWQPSWILPSCIQPFCTRKTSLIHSVSPWWW